MREPCPECGISPDDELTTEAYEVLWGAIPELRAAQDQGEEVRCSECGRRLTFREGGGRR